MSEDPAAIRPASIVVASATLAAAPLLAALHERAFPRPWASGEIASLLALPGTFALLGALEGEPAGFVLVRSDGTEAEVLTIAVAPEQRRRGVARRLLGAALDRLGSEGTQRLVLDVAEDNSAARALYAALDFREVGRRRRYYRSGADALVLAAGCGLDRR